MSHFSVPIKRITEIDPHPNADAIEFAVIDGYRSIVKKGEFQKGDLIAYIPEGALLPEWLLQRMGFWDAEKGCGKLHGKDGNRVKAIKLRGELSQGICVQVIMDSFNTGQIMTGLSELCFASVSESDDVSGILGVTKYEPPVPVAMSGEIFNAGQHLTVAFDVENWKAYPNVIADGEEVIFTEKLHGTFTGISVLPLKDAHPEAFGKNRNILIFSKGLGAKGLVFKNNKRNENNLYVRSTKALIEMIDAEEWYPKNEPDILMGETFGPGVQDLSYGTEVGFRLFARAIGYRGNQCYQNFDSLRSVAEHLYATTVPVLYRGPFSKEAMMEYTDGETVLNADHIREGIVMTPAVERLDPKIGRVCLKSVSADYLLRKNGTEYS
jgi:RNA ligase (TIGR02306 family)